MIIVLRPDATDEELRSLKEDIRSLGLEPIESRGRGGDAVVVRGETRRAGVEAALAAHPAAERIVPILPGRGYEHLFSRRSLLDFFLSGFGLLTLLGLGGVGSLFLLRSSKRLQEAGYLRAGSVDDFRARPYRMLSFRGSPIIVVRTARKRFFALAAICTHMEICQVQWVAKRQQFLCPCHRAAYDVYGNVLQGPPPRPLRSYAVEIIENQVYVKTTA